MREEPLASREIQTLEQQLEARDPDVRLMVQVRNDVQGAFETLLERYQNRLVGIFFHMVGSTEEAEDLCQEVFLRIYRARKGYRPRAKFATWLFTIANNLALNHLRRKGATRASPSPVPAARSRPRRSPSTSRAAKAPRSTQGARPSSPTWSARPWPRSTRTRRWPCCSTNSRR